MQDTRVPSGIHPLLLEIRQGARRPVCLDIGCGPSKVPGSIGIDALPYENVDLVGDVFDVLSQFPDGSVDHVHSKHFLEHLPDLGRLLDELARVMKTGGTVRIIVPHFTNPYYYSDPTHKTPFGLYTFCYYAKANGMFRRQVPTYQRKISFSIDDVELSFQTTPGQYVRSAFKKTLQTIVNINSYTQELYEEMFCYLFPCYELRYTLRRT